MKYSNKESHPFYCQSLVIPPRVDPMRKDLERFTPVCNTQLRRCIVVRTKNGVETPLSKTSKSLSRLQELSKSRNKPIKLWRV